MAPEFIGTAIGKVSKTICALQADQIDIEKDGTILVYPTVAEEGHRRDLAATVREDRSKSSAHSSKTVEISPEDALFVAVDGGASKGSYARLARLGALNQRQRFAEHR